MPCDVSQDNPRGRQSAFEVQAGPQFPLAQDSLGLLVTLPLSQPGKTEKPIPRRQRVRAKREPKTATSD